MKKDIADKWVAALRSGEFKQGRRALGNKVSNSFCCLGVLCELAVKEEVCKKESTENVYTYDARYTWYLPHVVKNWANMRTATGEIKSLNEYLYALNDIQMKSFTEIADIIEQHYEEL